jgi:hypothetical protein
MWQLYGAYAQGLSHQQEQLVCQDRVNYYEHDHIKAIALADGAGSYKYSEHGAEYISDIICKFFNANFYSLYENENRIFEIEKFINEQLNYYAQLNNYEIDELSSTLLVVAINIQTNQYISAHIGDGIIGIYRNQQLTLFSDAHNGESTNTTFMTTSENLYKYIRIQYGYLDEQTKGFIMLSDGGAHVLFDHKNKLFTNNSHKIIESAINGKLNNQILQIFTNDFLVPQCQVFDDCSIGLLVNLDNTNKEVNNGGI